MKGHAKHPTGKQTQEGGRLFGKGYQVGPSWKGDIEWLGRNPRCCRDLILMLVSFQIKPHTWAKTLSRTGINERSNRKQDSIFFLNYG